MDRLSDLKSDGLGTDEDGAPHPSDVELGATTDSSNAAELEEQLKVYEPIRQAITDTNRATAMGKKLLEELMKAAAESEKQMIIKKMNNLVANIQAQGLATKRMFDDISKANAEHAKANPGASTAQIRMNLLSKHTREFQASIRDFEAASAAFKKALQDATRRVLRNIGLDEKKIESVIDSGQAQKVLQASISGDMTDVIESIESRHASILALERSVREVQELFIDLAHLVAEQQESINSIEGHIAKTVDYVERGEKNLIDADSDQNAARKRQCCIVVIVVVALLVIVGPVILKTVNVF